MLRTYSQTDPNGDSMVTNSLWTSTRPEYTLPMKIPIFPGKYVKHAKWWIFHGYVSLRECIPNRCLIFPLWHGFCNLNSGLIVEWFLLVSNGMTRQSFSSKVSSLFWSFFAAFKNSISVKKENISAHISKTKTFWQNKPKQNTNKTKAARDMIIDTCSGFWMFLVMCVGPNIQPKYSMYGLFTYKTG